MHIMIEHLFSDSKTDKYIQHPSFKVPFLNLISKPKKALIGITNPLPNIENASKTMHGNIYHDGKACYIHMIEVHGFEEGVDNQDW